MSSIGFVFPGQGSQHAGMGRSLRERFPESAAVFEEADRELETPLSTLCFEGPEEALARTETTQPAILTVSVAAWRALDARGVKAAAAAGHSLGEYSAHVAAGTLGFADAVKTVRLRGRFMQEAVPVGEGAMAAILGLDRGPLERVCAEASEGEVVSPANFNGPGQIVIAGHAGAVARATALALQAGARKAVPLPVSAPFHCALMRPAGERLGQVLERLSPADPGIPVYTNVDAAPVRAADRAREALVRQVASPVRWHDLVEAMVSDGIDTFVEIGPGKVLAGLIRRIRREARVLVVNDAEDVEEAVSAIGGAA